MTEQKVDFLLNKFPKYLLGIPADKKQAFGKMNLHQMIEHMTWAFQLANGKIKIASTLEPQMVEKMHRFMTSDKSFRENTPNDKLPDEPLPVQTASILEAVNELSNEFEYLIIVFEKEKSLRIENPFFGMLNFEEQIHLLHKHAQHHLRQFDALPTE